MGDAADQLRQVARAVHGAFRLDQVRQLPPEQLVQAEQKCNAQARLLLVTAEVDKLVDSMAQKGKF